jgi:hypothetical protein
MTRAKDISKIVSDANFGGTLDVAGVFTGSSLDISGDIDVDGTTNLDIVDIDGAVDIATTLAVAGNTTVGGTLGVTGVLTGTSLDISGDIDVDGTTNLGVVDFASTTAHAGNATFADNAKAIFGSELEIYSDATHARIKENGSGQLKIQGNNMQLLTSDGTATYLEGNASTGVTTLYHASNAPKLATTSTGVTVTGDITASSLNGGQFGGRRNIIINGAMQINQRGASSVTSGYFVDRFTLSACSASAVLTSSTPTEFPKAISVSATSGNPIIIQKIESKSCQGLSGKTVTVSFYAKNISNATTLYASLQYAGSADNFGSTTTISEQNLGSLSGSWVRYTASWTVPSGGLNGLALNILCAGSSTFTMGVTGVQLEVGSVATPFEHRSFGEELALCQRYYEVFAPIATQNGSVTLHRERLDTNYYATNFYYIQKRATPAFTTNFDRAHKPAVTYDSVSSLAISVQTGEINSALIGCATGTNHPNSVSIYLGKATNTGTGQITIDAEL